MAAAATEQRPKPAPAPPPDIPNAQGPSSYGYLFEANKTPTKTLDALLRAIGQHIVSRPISVPFAVASRGLTTWLCPLSASRLTTSATRTTMP